MTQCDMSKGRLRHYVNKLRFRIRPTCQWLEDRTVPTTDIILDFDGGTTPSSFNYGIPNGADNVTWAPFAGFPTTPSGPVNRDEQILQIVAGVRQDYADFDVRVIWDDRGVNSPLFGGRDSLVMVTDTPGTVLPGLTPDVLGISPLDQSQSFADVPLVFVGSIIDGWSPTDAWRLINRTIGVISHEVGHSLGQSHVALPDSQFREIMFPTIEDNDLDSRFTAEQLPHTAPEAGAVYSERDRLQANLGFALAGATLGQNEILTNQTLSLDTPLISLDASGIGILSATIPFGKTNQPLSIEFAGDRDAFRVTLTAGTTYAIRERAAGSKIAPIVTLWDAQGDFVNVGNQGSVGGVSLLQFTPSKTGSYYIVTGTSYDRAVSGTVGTPSLGAYNLEITPNWLEIDSVNQKVRLNGDAGANSQSAKRDSGGLLVTSDANSMVVPTKYASSVEFLGATGNDNYFVGLSGGAFQAVVTDLAGFDQLVVDGSSAADLFTITSAQVTTSAGAKISQTGLEIVLVQGNNGNDAFTVTPGPTQLRVSGGNPTPPATPGDQLGITVAGGIQTVTNPTDGKFDFPGGQTITYTGIESIAGVVLPPLPPPPPRTSFAVGAGMLSLPKATLYSSGRDTPTYSIMAYDPSFRGGVRVATGDVNGDGVADLITAAGPTGGPHIQVFNGLLPQPLLGPLTSFFAYDPGFIGGVWIAAGDVNGDGRADIMTGADAGGGPHVKVFDAATGKLLLSFFAYAPGFSGGVRLAAGDVNGDGRADIITAPGPGGGPHVRVFSGLDGKVIREFFAYDPSFVGGVFVSASDVNGDGRADIATGTGQGGGPLVTIRDGATGGQLHRFYAFPPGSPGSGGLTSTQAIWSSGVRVALADTDGDGVVELYAAPGQGRPSILKAFLASTGAEFWSKPPADPTYLGGVVLGS